MALSAGTRLGPYEIQSPLGAGGMGEVYRARDTKLNRDVAIKVLPATLANDPERMARFSREAQVLASLNHPHIAQIHGLEDVGDVRAIVMELVEGLTLADRIAQGPIPPGEALPIATQLAEALEAAHERGIIHRDLKPANIKVRPDGTVKVLDFGLAKALDPAGTSSANAMMSPTLSMHATQAGVILGTAAYMSPEQAAGKMVDKRSDLWAFGVVLLEMLTGRPAFTGETVSHVLASVLKSEPDWTALPAETPTPIRRLLRRCLMKDCRRRLDSAAAARLEIDDALGSPAPETAAAAPSSRRAVPVIIALALAGAALLSAFVTWAAMRRASPSAPLPSRFAITPPPAQPMRIDRFDRSIAISSDGRHLVYTLPAEGTGGPLMVRAIDQLEARHLAGIPAARSPFVSPDGRWIGFFTDTELQKVSIGGGPAITICRLTGGPRGASWGDDNTITFATSDPATGLWRVPAGGGEPAALTTPDAAGREGDHIFPIVLPAGRGVLFTIAPPDQVENSQVAIVDSTTGRPKTLIRGGSQAEYVDSGHLVYAAAGTLRAVRFDLATLEVLSDPAPVLEQVKMQATGAANYALSRSGTLLYIPGAAAAQEAQSLVWVDRKGHEEPIKAPPRGYAIARLSPDGTRVALDIRDEENDIWIWDLVRETLRKVTYDAGVDQMPVWTPDGRSVVFTSNRGGALNLYRQAADGAGTVDRLTTSESSQFPSSITVDGAGMVGHEHATSSFDVVLFSLAAPSSGPSPASSKPAGAGAVGVKPLVRSPFVEHNAEISPDGRYLAYQSNESGRFEVYVRPFPQVDSGKWQVSTDGGARAAWARNGHELFYFDGSLLMAVPVQTSGSTFSWGNAAKLFDSPYAPSVVERDYDVSPDGKRFLMLKEHAAGGAGAATASMIVVLDWVEELKARVPGK